MMKQFRWMGSCKSLFNGMLLLGLLLCLASPRSSSAARPWPDTRFAIIPFSDQLPNSLNATQRWFAATHYAGTQKMLRSEIQALRVYNTNFLCLHYQLGAGAGTPAFILGDTWGSDWAFVNAQSNWFLLNPSGQRVHQTQWNWDVMDLRYANGQAVSGFPAYWISNCIARIRAAEDDGVFADSFTPDSYGFGQSNPSHPWLEDVDLCRSNWIPSLEQFGRAARQALAATNGFVFLPNLGGLVTSWMAMDYGLGHGGMIEGFAFWGPGSYLDPADWELQIDRALTLVRSNKIVICQSYPAAGSAQERMFATASYLLIKGSATYLNLLATDDVALEYYPEYTLDLGGARGAFPANVSALWNAGWGVFRRDYTNGVVVVNPGASSVTISNLGATYWRVSASGGGLVNASGSYGGTLSASAATNLTLPAFSGAVLFATNLFGAGTNTATLQPTNFQAFHRSGQTFLTWNERADLAGESYRLYRHTQPITTANLAAATRIYEVWEGSADFPANRYDDSGFQARYFDRVVITNRGSPLPAGTGLLVWTLATNDFAGGTTGSVYYAITTVSAAGVENTNQLLAGNTTGPLAEGVAEPLPVEAALSVGTRGHLYLQFMDLRKWNPTFHAPHAGNGFYGLDPESPAVRHALAYAYDYVVFAPDCGTNPVPVTLSLHGWSGNAYGPVTADPDPWDWCTYRIYPVDQSETWWFGFAQNHDFRAGGEIAAGDVIVNYTEQRVLRMIRDLQRQPPGPPVNTNRVYIYGHSMGGSGTLAFALRYPNVFAAAYASEPMTDYSTSGNGGGTDWRGDVETKWGSRALNLPIRLDGPAGWANPLKAYDGTGVWMWQNHRANATNRIGADNVPFGLGHGTNDMVIEWPTQGRPVYGALDASRRCWGGVVTASDHSWLGFAGLPPTLAANASLAPFAGFQVVRNETVPGLSRASGNLVSPPVQTGGYNQNLDWSASWNAWDGSPQDSATNWQMSLRATDGITHTVDVTPRRTQQFHPTNGAVATWRNLRVSDSVQIQSGTATADVYGLITVSNVTVSPAGNRLRLEWNSGLPVSRTFYVATNGNDAQVGSLAQPWRSPGFASRQLAPGDTLIIRGGRYIQSVYDADILVPPSGRSDAWITIRGEEGNRPVLAGRNNLYSSMILGGRSYLRIENLEITHDTNALGSDGFFREGINLMGEPVSTNIVLNNLYIHHLDQFGLDAQDVNFLTITNCRFEYCGFGAIGGPAGAHGGLRNLSIRNSRLAYSGHYYQGGDGSTRPYDRPDGFGIEASVGPVEIMDTTSEHNYGDGLDSKAAHTTIRRCLVANNSCDGVKLWDGGTRVENTLIYGRGDGDPTPTPWALVVIGNPAPSDPNFEFINMTVADQHSGNYLLYAQYDYPAVPLQITFRNCIFQSVDSSISINGASTLTADHNLFCIPGRPAEVLLHGATTYTSNTLAALGSGNLYGDPLFLAPAWGATGDFRLRSTSPAINLGITNGAPMDDLNLQPRVVPPDAGAYEWVSGPVLSVTPTNREVATVAGTTTFAITNAGSGTMAYTASEAESWLVISGGGGGTNGGTITVAYETNSGTSMRTGMVVVTALGASGSPRSVTVVQAANVPPAASRKINCGGAATGNWVADTGGTTSVDGGADSFANAIANVGDVPQAVYQTRRYGKTVTYNLAIPDGTYNVRLHFAELYWTAAGKKRFNVTIEGRTVWTNLDLFVAAGGKNRALTRTFENVAVSGGLQIQGVASVGAAQFHGIEVWLAGPVPPVNSLTINPASTNLSATASSGMQISITANVPWTATTNQSWLAITGGSSGSTNGTVVYSALANGGTTARTGTITVAGGGITRTCMVIQVGLAPAVSRKINCGGGATGSWETDTGGTTSADGGADSFANAIANAGDVPQAVYQTRRYGKTVTYNLAIPDGTYSVRLYFAELYWTAAGKKRFNVTLEGRTVLTNLDLFVAAGGKNIAMTRTFENVVVSGGLQIQGVASVGAAQFHGIEVWSAGAAAKRVLLAKSSATWPMAEARSGDSSWVAAPELMDGDTNTLWTGGANATSWAVALDFGESMPLQSLDILYKDQPWANVGVMGTGDLLEWFDLGLITNGPIPCRALYLHLPADGSGSAPAIREIRFP